MKKGILYITTLIACIALFSGCNKSNTLTINPSMTASLGTYTFNAGTITPSLLKPQLNDTVTSLIITGYDPTIKQTIVLTVRNYKEQTGTFSIIMGQASGTFNAYGVTNTANSGIIAITNITTNTITGYYSFTTTSGIVLTNGAFVVGRPWSY